jgi:hypothetical protein
MVFAEYLLTGLDFDDSINNPRLRPKGNYTRRNTNNGTPIIHSYLVLADNVQDDSTVMSDEEVHIVPLEETEAEVSKTRTYIPSNAGF